MSTKRTYDMIPLLKKFVVNTSKDKRRMPSGQKMTKGTKQNYQLLLERFLEFKELTQFDLKVYSLTSSNKRAYNQARLYHQKLYDSFTEFLYTQRGLFDNSVGNNIKQLKVFYKWLNINEGIFTGDFYKNFYVWKEEIPIIVLNSEQLTFLIYDEEFHNSLTGRISRAKDIFVFGCTVALRVSDLLKLRKSNIETIGATTYLRTISQKTGTYTKIKLPPYAIDIVKRNNSKGVHLFSPIGAGNLNLCIKAIAERAGWIYEYPKIRTRRGKQVVIINNPYTKIPYRFCDLLSSHTMRRTAITTMLNLGVEERNVRKISGHAPGSTEFFKYVKYSQEKIDVDLDNMYDKLAEKRLHSSN